MICGVGDSRNGQFGGVFLLKDEAFPQWIDMNAGDYDVYAVSFAPDFGTSRQIVIVAGDETGTFVINKSGNAGWGEDGGIVRLTPDEGEEPL